MADYEKMQLFEDQPIRTAWDEEQEEWYFSVVDVVGVLTGQDTPRGASNYWAKLKQRLKEEGADQLLTNCQQLKLKATDGKRRLTDVATTEQLLRIIQSVPSPRAEPLKMWLAQVGAGTYRRNTRPGTDRRAPSRHLRAPGLYPRVDQPALAGHLRPQGADRRMERQGRYTAQRICHSD